MTTERHEDYLARQEAYLSKAKGELEYIAEVDDLLDRVQHLTGLGDVAFALRKARTTAESRLGRLTVQHLSLAL